MYRLLLPALGALLLVHYLHDELVQSLAHLEKVAHLAIPAVLAVVILYRVIKHEGEIA